MSGTYGAHDNPNRCQSFSHENRKAPPPKANFRTPNNKMSLCTACKTKWERNNWPMKCVLRELQVPEAGGGK